MRLIWRVARAHRMNNAILKLARHTASSSHLRVAPRSFYNGAAAQYAWLEADLAAVDRVKTPWLIVFGHRSIYCSCDGDCDAAATTVREGAYGMEALFMKYGVDLFVNGHEHDCTCALSEAERVHACCRSNAAPSTPPAAARTPRPPAQTSATALPTSTLS